MGLKPDGRRRRSVAATSQSDGAPSIPPAVPFRDSDVVVALAGNPNVGKSTIFNALTGMRQHTGNWPGKTVTSARGRFDWNGRRYALMDLPGCYSLMARSAEEEVARDYICFERPEVTVVVCDATCLERNLNLALQILEVADRVVICVNLMDEAKKKGVSIDLALLSARLGAPVVGTAARGKDGLKEFARCVERESLRPARAARAAVAYPDHLERAIAELEPLLSRAVGNALPVRWLALRLLEDEAWALRAVRERVGVDLSADEPLLALLGSLRTSLTESGADQERLRDELASSVVRAAESACQCVALFQNPAYADRDLRMDRVLASRWLGFPVMFLALLAILWLTVSGSNIPSALLEHALFALEQPLRGLLNLAGAPGWLGEMLSAGAYRVLAWVVSVMLPPMAIFFPLFTLLEDAGYLPRVAFNLDKLFQRCGACGKQALTMCMGLGCNAVGVSGCRIIDSPRERLIAILTNSLMPCNGRFPLLIAMFAMFFAGTGAGLGGSALSAALLGCALAFSVAMTLAASKLLSRTVLRGAASAFVLELPPYRRPQFGRVLARSLLDRTVFVLGRAAAVAVPAGALLWGMANVHVYGLSLLAHCAGFLDPLGRLLGMDGVILLAFALGLPANEIVLPIILMAYTAQGDLQSLGDLRSLKEILTANGWTWITAMSVTLFSLMHWPCSTTCLTIYRETKSLRWSGLSIALPTLFGFAACLVFACAARLLTGL